MEKWILIVVTAVVLVGVVYHHAWPCEGMDRVSGQIVVGDSIEDVMQQLRDYQI